MGKREREAGVAGVPVIHSRFSMHIGTSGSSNICLGYQCHRI